MLIFFKLIVEEALNNSIGKEISKTSPRYTLSDIYTSGGKPFAIEDKVSDKLLYITNVHHTFNELLASKHVYPYYDYILLNVHDAYLHPRRPRGPFSIHKYNSSFIFIVNDPQDKCRSFCKILKYLCGEKNPDIKAKNYIEQLFKSEGDEIAIQKEEVIGDTIILKHRATKIMVDGNHQGYFLLCSHPTTSRGSHLHLYIEYIPLVNDIESGTSPRTHGDTKSVSFHR